MDRWLLCGYDIEESSADGLLKPKNYPIPNNLTHNTRQGQRYCQNQKISLKEKKSLINYEQKVQPLK